MPEQRTGSSTKQKYDCCAAFLPWCSWKSRDAATASRGATAITSSAVPGSGEAGAQGAEKDPRASFATPKPGNIMLEGHFCGKAQTGSHIFELVLPIHGPHGSMCELPLSLMLELCRILHAASQGATVGAAAVPTSEVGDDQDKATAEVMAKPQEYEDSDDDKGFEEELKEEDEADDRDPWSVWADLLAILEPMSSSEAPVNPSQPEAVVTEGCEAQPGILPELVESRTTTSPYPSMLDGSFADMDTDAQTTISSQDRRHLRPGSEEQHEDVCTPTKTVDDLFKHHGVASEVRQTNDTPAGLEEEPPLDVDDHLKADLATRASLLQRAAAKSMPSAAAEAIPEEMQADDAARTSFFQRVVFESRAPVAIEAIPDTIQAELAIMRTELAAERDAAKNAVATVELVRRDLNLQRQHTDFLMEILRMRNGASAQRNRLGGNSMESLTSTQRDRRSGAYVESLRKDRLERASLSPEPAAKNESSRLCLRSIRAPLYKQIGAGF